MGYRKPIDGFFLDDPFGYAIHEPHLIRVGTEHDEVMGGQADGCRNRRDGSSSIPSLLVARSFLREAVVTQHASVADASVFYRPVVYSCLGAQGEAVTAAAEFGERDRSRHLHEGGGGGRSARRRRRGRRARERRAERRRGRRRAAAGAGVAGGGRRREPTPKGVEPRAALRAPRRRQDGHVAAAGAPPRDAPEQDPAHDAAVVSRGGPRLGVGGRVQAMQQHRSLEGFVVPGLVGRGALSGLGVEGGLRFRRQRGVGANQGILVQFTDGSPEEDAFGRTFCSPIAAFACP